MILYTCNFIRLPKGTFFRIAFLELIIHKFFQTFLCLFFLCIFIRKGEKDEVSLSTLSTDPCS